MSTAGACRADTGDAPRSSRSKRVSQIEDATWSNGEGTNPVVIGRGVVARGRGRGRRCPPRLRQHRLQITK